MSIAPGRGGRVSSSLLPVGYVARPRPWRASLVSATKGLRMPSSSSLNAILGDISVPNRRHSTVPDRGRPLLRGGTTILDGQERHQRGFNVQKLKLIVTYEKRCQRDDVQTTTDERRERKRLRNTAIYTISAGHVTRFHGVCK